MQHNPPFFFLSVALLLLPARRATASQRRPLAGLTTPCSVDHSFLQIYEGTSEIQHIVIASSLLKAAAEETYISPAPPTKFKHGPTA